MRNWSGALLVTASLASASLAIAPLASAMLESAAFIEPQGGRAWREATSAGVVNEVRFDEASGFVYSRVGEQWKRTSFASGISESVEAEVVPAPTPAVSKPGRAAPPARGRQRSKEVSPDGIWTAVSEDGNIRLEREGASPRAVTTEGKGAVKFGTGSWVYGEELDQNTAMWWSPDSRTLAFYGFDETAVPPYYMLSGNTKLRTTIESERYPKPGDPNPKVRLLAYDIESQATREIAVGDMEYVYNIRFSPNGNEILFNRTNRWQNQLELCAWDLKSGVTRVVLTETQPCWQENSPQMRILADGRRFIWGSERTGFRQYELRSLDSPEVVTLTRGEFPCNQITEINEALGQMWFSANSGAMPLNAQYHRAGLDGTGQICLTPANRFHSRFNGSPSGAYFICSDETTDEPPTTKLYRADGTTVAVLAQGVTDPWTPLGLQKPQLIAAKAADGMTPIHAIVWKPKSFDPAQQYPMVVHVYGGPLSTAFTGAFSSPDERCERGFITMKAENRGTQGRGKAFETGAYLQLGQADLDDQAAAASQVAAQCSVDPKRIGIIGSSYGGYMAALSVMRHPQVFCAGVAESAVTDWRNYDTIYTERFMRTPTDNPEGYKQGSCVELANSLAGKLLLVHGMGDDNVHPTNMWQLANQLQGLSRPFEMMVFPEAGHGVWGPFCENLEWDFLARELKADPAN